MEEEDEGPPPLPPNHPPLIPTQDVSHFTIGGRGGGARRGMGLDEDEDTMEEEDEGPPPLPPNHPPLIPTQDVSHFTIGGRGGGG